MISLKLQLHENDLNQVPKFRIVTCFRDHGG